MTNRKVVLYIATSIDGFIADKDGGINWLNTNETTDMPDTYYEDFYQHVDTVILGRTTYDQVVNDLSPDFYPYGDSTSYVLTTQNRESKENIIFTNQSVTKLVKELKEQPGKDIFIVGGASIVTPLIEANLIDEYQLATIPVILGEGIPLFNPISQPLALKPISVKLVNQIIYQTFSNETL